MSEEGSEACRYHRLWQLSEAQLAGAVRLLRRAREHTDHCDMCGGWREENLAPFLNEIDAFLSTQKETK